MPRFEPFRGLRYDTSRVRLDDVVAPPYDVIDAADRERLARRSPYNVVAVDLPGEDDGGYQAACRHLESWRTEGILAADPEPAFYVYRMGFSDDEGRRRQTTGVVGALELSVPGEGDVLPHERTLAKAKDDRLRLLRACRANLSPVWCVSLAAGLSDLCEPSGPPLARCTDDEGVHHRLWRVDRPAVVTAISELVATTPVVIADGHHRYETALAYRDERRAVAGEEPGEHDLLMALVVELAPDQLGVRPIHRMVADLPEGYDLMAVVSRTFESAGTAASGAPELQAAMAATGGPGLVTRAGSWTLRPRRLEADVPDAVLLDPLLAELPGRLVFEHRADAALAAVGAGTADAGFLLRPATVEHIAAAAAAGTRMPEKTTFFHPKPRTGMVFRALAD